MFDRHLQAELSDLEWTVALAPSARRAPLAWVIDELMLAWQSAQHEAVDAYAAWSHSRAGDAYAAYRAAQDRADAAQDTLAERCAELYPKQLSGYGLTMAPLERSQPSTEAR